MEERMVWLDVVRVLAIVLVVSFHIAYELNPDPNLRIFGFFGVSLFFIASGFALAAHYPKLTSFDLGWFWKRYVKIASLYYPALIVIVFLFSSQTYYGGINDLFLHLLFLNFLSPDRAFSIISPSWFIIPLLGLYLLFPYLNRFAQSKFFLSLAFLLTLVFRLYNPGWTSFSPLFFIGDFCFGISLAKRENILLLSSLLVAFVEPGMALPFIIFYALHFLRPSNNPVTGLFTFISNHTFEFFLFHESIIMVVFSGWRVFSLNLFLSLLVLLLSMLAVICLSRAILIVLLPSLSQRKKPPFIN